jgi:hypothetical protein
MLGPTLVAGLLFGTLAGLPYVKLFNVCSCCSLVVGCGACAAFLYSRRCRRAGRPFRPGSGALVGLIAGVFFGVSTATAGAVSRELLGEPGLVTMLLWLRDNPATPPQTAATIEATLRQMADPALTLGDYVFGLAFSILHGAAFSTVGGLIGGTLFEVVPPPELPDRGELSKEREEGR